MRTILPISIALMAIATLATAAETLNKPQVTFTKDVAPLLAEPLPGLPSPGHVCAHVVTDL